MPRVSVIVTSYNIESYIEQCLDGIVGQTLEDIEIIVVDDGSTDSTPDIISRYAASDSRIVPVLMEENTIGGVASAANAGMDRATGDWVGFADGDDVYDPHMFERLLEAGVANDADLAMCQYVLLDDEDESLSEPADAHRWSALTAPAYDLDVARRKQILRFIAVPWRKLYRRSMLEEHAIRFPVGDYFYEDNPFHWFSVLTASRIAVVPEVLCQHRVARAGQTMATADERLFRIFQHHDTILEWLRANGHEAEYAPNLLGWAISQMEWISRRTPPELRPQLFDILRHVFAQHDDTVIARALDEANKGSSTRALVAAVTTDDFATFDTLLGHRSVDRTLVQKARHHLETAGVRETSRIATKFAGQQVKKRAGFLVRAKRRLLGRSAARGPMTVENQDLLFAIMVMERRLDAIERQLRDMSSTG